MTPAPVDKEKLIKELIVNKRIASEIKKHNLSTEQIEEALPIFIDMAQEKDDENTKYLTSLKIVNGNVQRVQVRSSYYQNFAYLENIITQQYEPINFEDEQTFLKENGRKKAISALAKIWKNSDLLHQKGLYLFGDIGIGKTFILKRIAKMFASKNFKVAFITPMTLSKKIKDSFAQLESQSELVDLLKNVDCLFIDDIGAETVSSWFRDDILFNILNTRMHYQKITFFSSNYPPEKLVDIQARTAKQTFKDWDKAKRLVSRVQALAIPIMITGQNKRY